MGIKAIGIIEIDQETKAIEEIVAIKDNSMTRAGEEGRDHHQIKNIMMALEGTVGTGVIAEAIPENNKGDLFILRSHTLKNKHKKSNKS